MSLRGSKEVNVLTL